MKSSTDIKSLPTLGITGGKTFNIFGSTQTNFFIAAAQAAQAEGLNGAFNYPNKTANGNRIGGGILRETGSGIPVELGGRYTSGPDAIYLNPARAAAHGATYAGSRGWSQRIIRAALQGHLPGSTPALEGWGGNAAEPEDAAPDHSPAARWRSPRVEKDSSGDGIGQASARDTESHLSPPKGVEGTSDAEPPGLGGEFDAESEGPRNPRTPTFDSKREDLERQQSAAARTVASYVSTVAGIFPKTHRGVIRATRRRGTSD